MGETRVDLQHLLEDLRDAYTGDIEETILTEIIANSLDSGATRISLSPNAVDATLTVIDDGRGMQRRELSKYHDIATSSKARGEGIGFAGVGIKLGLLISREVVTETRRGATHVATRWHLASRHRAPWKWITPPGLVSERGTAVRLVLANPMSPLLDAPYLEQTIRRHFESLLDPAFDALLARHYRNGVTFEVGGQPLMKIADRGGERVEVSVRLGRKRNPSALGVLVRDHTMAPDRAGIAISTFGKVIKRGWEWLGLTSVTHVSGLIEAPELAACLTLSKNDFIRTGARGATYLAYRKALQEVLSRQLAAWDDTPQHAARPRTERLERDLARVLEDLADDFPLLRSLVDRRAGGQKPLPMPGRGRLRVPGSLFAMLPDDGSTSVPGHDAGSTADPQVDRQDSTDQPPEPAVTPPAHSPPSPAAASGAETVTGARRPARYGLTVKFESRPDDSELGRLVDSTIWINDAHPAYHRATASRSIAYHTALAVALALAPLAVEPHHEHAFLTGFLMQWGASGRKR